MSQDREDMISELLDLSDCPHFVREEQESLTYINRRLMRLVAPHSRFGPGLSLVSWNLEDTFRFLGTVSNRVIGSTNWLDLAKRMYDVSSDKTTQRYEPRREFRFSNDELRDLRFLVVKLVYAYAHSENDKRLTKRLSTRIADELNISKRTIERTAKRIAADESRSFALFDSVVSERHDLAILALEIYRSIVKPRAAIVYDEFGPNDWQSFSVVKPLKRIHRERPNFPKSPERRHAHAVLILRSSIASAARLKADELTLETARRVLGSDAPNAETIDELLDALANRDSGRVREQEEKPEPIGYIGFKVIHQATLAEIDARLEAEAMRLDGDETEQYVRIHTDPKTLTLEAVREIARKTDDEIAELACEFGPNCEVARLFGIEANETDVFVELHNRLDPRERLGSVIADLFNVSRRLRLHFRLDEKPDREPSEEPRTARARRRGARLRARTSKPGSRQRSRRRE